MLSLLFAVAMAATDPSVDDQRLLLDSCTQGDVDACRSWVGTSVRMLATGAHPDRIHGVRGVLRHACDLGDTPSCQMLGEVEADQGPPRHPHGLPTLPDGRPVQLRAPQLHLEDRPYDPVTTHHPLWFFGGQDDPVSIGVPGYHTCPIATLEGHAQPVVGRVTWAMLSAGTTCADGPFALARIDVATGSAMALATGMEGPPVLLDADETRALVRVGPQLQLSDGTFVGAPDEFTHGWLAGEQVVAATPTGFVTLGAGSRAELDVDAVLGTHPGGTLAVVDEDPELGLVRYVADAHGQEQGDIRPLLDQIPAERGGDLLMEHGQWWLPQRAPTPAWPTRAAPAPYSRPAAPQTGASLTGTVKGGRRGLRGATVWVQASTEGWSLPPTRAVTDRYGRFSFRDLPRGVVVVGVLHGTSLDLQTVDTRTTRSITLAPAPGTPITITTDATDVRSMAIGAGGWRLDMTVEGSTGVAIVPADQLARGLVVDVERADGIGHTAVVGTDLGFAVDTSHPAVAVQVLDDRGRPRADVPVVFESTTARQHTTVRYSDARGWIRSPRLASHQWAPRSRPDLTCAEVAETIRCRAPGPAFVSLPRSGRFWVEGDPTTPGAPVPALTVPLQADLILHGWLDGGLHRGVLRLDPHRVVDLQPEARRCTTLLDSSGSPLALTPLTVDLVLDDGHPRTALALEAKADGTVCLPTQGRATLHAPGGLGGVQMVPDLPGVRLEGDTPATTTAYKPQRLPPARLKVDRWADQHWRSESPGPDLDRAVRPYSPGVYLAQGADDRWSTVLWQNGTHRMVLAGPGATPVSQSVVARPRPTAAQASAQLSTVPDDPRLDEAPPWLTRGLSLLAGPRQDEPLKGAALTDSLVRLAQQGCPRAARIVERAVRAPQDPRVRAAAYMACGVSHKDDRALPMPTGLLAHHLRSWLDTQGTPAPALMEAVTDAHGWRRHLSPYLDALRGLTLPTTHDTTVRSGPILGCALRLDARGRVKPVRDADASCAEGTLVLAPHNARAVSLLDLEGHPHLAVRGDGTPVAAYEPVTTYALSRETGPAQAQLEVSGTGARLLRGSDRSMGAVGALLLSLPEETTVTLRIGPEVTVQRLAEVLYVLGERLHRVEPLVEELEPVQHAQASAWVVSPDGADVGAIDLDPVRLQACVPEGGMHLARFLLFPTADRTLAAVVDRSWASATVNACLTDALSGQAAPRHVDPFYVEVALTP